jgi:hypothetical protein
MKPMSRAPLLAAAVVVPVEHGQIYVGDPAGADPDHAEAAFDDAQGSRRFVGVSGGLLDIITASEDTHGTAVLVEVWDAEPPDDRADWQHEVDVDVPFPSGELVVDYLEEGPAVAVPPGDYRVRVSGRALDIRQRDEFRLRLWPAPQPQGAELRKAWDGWSTWR